MSKYKKIKIEEIPDYDFEGYYWYSDRPKPEVIHNGKIDKSKFTSLPFVIEANFYARDKKVSIQVKNIDAVPHVARIDLNGTDDKVLFPRVVYKGHDLEGRSFEMVEAWEETEDELLEGMKTLQPAWSAFAGFVK